MKTFCFMLMLAAAVAAAQTTVNPDLPPDVQILNHSFFEHIVRSYYTAPFPDPHPYVNPVTGVHVEQSGWKPDSKQFRYQMKIRNAGAREIRVIDWAYVFTDPRSQEEVGRHYFRSNEKIGRNKEKIVFGTSTSFPTQVVTVVGTGKADHHQYAEHLEICDFTHPLAAAGSILLPLRF